MDHKEGWVLKNCCFWIVELDKTLENPLDCKEIQPVHPKWNQHSYSLVGLVLKLNLQYFGHLIWRADSLEKAMMLVKIEGRRRRRRQRMRWLDDITDSMDMSLSSSGRWWWTGKPGGLPFVESQRVGRDLVTEQQQQCACNWITEGKERRIRQKKI